MPRLTADEMWTRILRNEGQVFHTLRGEPLTYAVEGNVILPSRTSYRLSRATFETALGLMPVSGPAGFGKAVRGPSYVFAILTDPRISG